MPFSLRTRVGSRNHLFGYSRTLPAKYCIVGIPHNSLNMDLPVSKLIIFQENMASSNRTPVIFSNNFSTNTDQYPQFLIQRIYNEFPMFTLCTLRVLMKRVPA